MIRTRHAASFLLLVAAAALGACANETGSDGTAQLALVNASTAAIGAHLKIDGLDKPFPGMGQSSSIEVTGGSHELTLTGSSGAALATSTFTIPAGSRRAAVFTGTNSNSVTLSIVSDTISTNPGGGYRSIVGSMLMVHSAQGAGPFNLAIRQPGSDSVVRMGNFAFGAGSLPPPAPYGFYVPFVPGTYLIDISNPGSETSLAHTQLTLATDDKWIVMLGYSIEGGLVLQATKQ